MIKCLEEHKFENLILVTGYLSNQIDSFIQSNDIDLNIRRVHNPDYSSTNNIYSLWKASPYIKDSFVLIGCDLILERSVIKSFKSPNRIALDKFNPDIHNGTTASVCNEGFLEYLHFNKRKCEKTSTYVQNCKYHIILLPKLA